MTATIQINPNNFMQYLTGIYMTDGVCKNGHQYSVRALESAIAKSMKGAPSSINHDITRMFGRTYVNGLYLSHELSYVIGKTAIAETPEEEKLIRRVNADSINLIMIEAIAKYKDAFLSYLESKQVGFGDYKLGFQNIVTFEKRGVVNELFPKLVKLIDEKDDLILVKDLLKEFKYAGQGIFVEKYKNLAIILHPYLRLSQNRFNDFDDIFLDSLMDEYSKGNDTLKFKIDLNVVGYKPSLIKTHNDDYWYVPEYDDKIDVKENKLAQKNTQEYEAIFNQLDRTEYKWVKMGEENLHQLEIEEVRKDPTPSLSATIEKYGCRYVHAIYDDKAQIIQHFDGAVRAYDFEKMYERIDAPMTDCGHDTEYTKIFRIDGKLKVSTWKKMLTLYLKNNTSVYDYLGVQSPKQAISLEDIPKDPLKKYLPYSIRKDDGVRLYISYHPRVECNEERKFCTTDIVTTENGKEECMEFRAIEVAKCIWKCGGKIELPKGGKYLIVEDYNNNIPMIMHGDVDTTENLKLTIAGIKKLMEKHYNRKDDDVYTFCLSWNMEDMNVCLSILGHSSDIHRWLKKVSMIPTTHKDFVSWIETQSRYIKKRGTDSEEPIGNDFIKGDGMLYLQRRCTQVDATIVGSRKSEDGNYVVNFEVGENKELYDLLSSEKIRFTPEFIASGAKIYGTNEDYLTTDKSGVIGEVEYIPDVKMLGFVWTNKPRPVHLV